MIERLPTFALFRFRVEWGSTSNRDAYLFALLVLLSRLLLLLPLDHLVKPRNRQPFVFSSQPMRSPPKRSNALDEGSARPLPPDKTPDVGVVLRKACPDEVYHLPGV